MAIVKCPDCGKDVSDMLKNCPHCGRPIKSEAVINLMGVLLTLALFYGIWLYVSSPSKSAAPRQEDKGLVAYSMAQVMVEDRLKAPSTADFPVYTPGQVVSLGDRKWRVVSYVDAQNSFGAKVRTHYEVTIQEDPARDGWMLLDIKLPK
jgi:hypothetical protein